ncbi:hypothetical protein K7432_004261 [Basidiobolus ranarum]|uniref:Biogenesis of lysosome-related organelles complex 1 subunit 5 n=1 Tax=Basidiobolus ranarum TaxID=34480 RepID=A0ABR2WYG7_9FUNG
MTEYKPNYEAVFEDVVGVFDTIFHHPKENLERETSFVLNEFEIVRQDREPENLKRSLEYLKAAQTELNSLEEDADVMLKEHQKNVKEVAENIFTLKSTIDTAENTRLGNSNRAEQKAALLHELELKRQQVELDNKAEYKAMLQQHSDLIAQSWKQNIEL